MTEEAAQRLETHRNDGESFTEFALRLAAICDDVDADTSVTETEPKRSGAVTVEELEARLADLEARLPPKTVDEFEMRSR